MHMNAAAIISTTADTTAQLLSDMVQNALAMESALCPVRPLLLAITSDLLLEQFAGGIQQM